MDHGARASNWWRKLSYEIPLVVGDALWEVLVVQFAAFLDGLTLRRVFEFVIIAMLAMAFAQTFPIDLAILFAGDTLMYFEILMIVRLAAGREFFVAVWRLATRLARLALHGIRAAIERPVSCIDRRRERHTVARSRKPRSRPARSDDGEGPAIAWGTLAAA
jgi:hypothetical protein